MSDCIKKAKVAIGRVYEGDVGIEKALCEFERYYNEIDLSALTAYLKIGFPDGTTDKFVMDKEISDDKVVLTKTICARMSKCAGVVEAQVSLENSEGTVVASGAISKLHIRDAVSDAVAQSNIIPSAVEELQRELQGDIEDIESELAKITSPTDAVVTSGVITDTATRNRIDDKKPIKLYGVVFRYSSGTSGEIFYTAVDGYYHRFVVIDDNYEITDEGSIDLEDPSVESVTASGDIKSTDGEVIAKYDIESTNGDIVARSGYVGADGDVISENGNVEARKGCGYFNSLEVAKQQGQGGDASVDGDLTVGEDVEIGGDLTVTGAFSKKYGANLSLTMNGSTFVLTAQLKDQDGNNLGSAQTVDLPLESVVVGGSYDDTAKKVVLTLQSGSTIEFSVADLIDGLQSEITAQNPLSADLIVDGTTNKVFTATEQSKLSGIEAGAEVNTVDSVNGQTGAVVLDADDISDSATTNKFVTAADKAAWNAKQDALTFDNVPTVNGNNPVKSGGVYTALSGKQDALTFDSTPTAGSSNPVTSGGVKSAIDAAISTIDTSSYVPTSRTVAGNALSADLTASTLFNSLFNVTDVTVNE